MSMTFGLNEAFQLIQAAGIIGALMFTAVQYRALKKESGERAFRETVDRMNSIRALIISDGELHKLFDGGKEGDALTNLECYKHYYLTKMILHMNESLYLFLVSESCQENSSRYKAWENNLRVDLSSPIVQSVWANQIVQDAYHQSFQQKVNQFIRATPSAVDNG